MIVPLGTIVSSSFSLLAAVLSLPVPLLFPGAVRALASAHSALSCAHSLLNGREEAVPARYCLFVHFFFVFFSFFGLFMISFFEFCHVVCRVVRVLRGDHDDL